MKIEALHDLYLGCSKICTDSRNIEPGSMFFALKGENFDGNSYASDALVKGASYSVVDDPTVVENDRFILVQNVLKTLQELSNFHRNRSNATFIALTGSNGKTTTKELIFEVLKTTYKTQCTQGNFNNHIGVPLTLLSIKSDTEYAVIEMGANHQGEIAFLSSIADPDFGYITNFGKAHLEGFGGIEGVIKGKSELYRHLMKKDGFIFVNAQDQKQMELTSGYENRILFNGADKTDLNSEFISSEPFVKFRLNNTTIDTKLTGHYNFHNISVAVAMGKYFGVEDENIVKAISGYTPVNNRSQIIEVQDYTIVLDAYNANPSSMIEALSNFDKLASVEKVAILGDMFELGEYAREEHQSIADFALDTSITKLWLVGENFFGVSASDSRCRKFRNFEDLNTHWKANTPESGHVLLKGSRGMALERLLNKD